MPTSYGQLPLGQAVPTSLVATAAQLSGLGSKNASSRKLFFARVTKVFENGDIGFESLENNLGKSSLGEGFVQIAQLGSNNINSIPYVGELVEIYQGPSHTMSFGKAQPRKILYYRPASLNIWNNQNNNIVLDPSVGNEFNDDKLSNISVENYDNSLDGFATNRSYANAYIPYTESYIPYPQTLTDANAQKQWLLSYIQSPQYFARLKKEFPGKDDVYVKTEQQKRINNLQFSQFKIVPKIKAVPGDALGVMIPKHNKPDAFRWDWPTRQWILETSLPPERKFQTGTVYLEKTQYTGWEGMATHESSHIVDDGGFLIPLTTVQKIHNYTGGGDQTTPETKIGNLVFDYISSPTEFIARLNVTRYLLNQQGIYDAKARAFTPQDYDKMLLDPTIKNNAALDDILSKLKGNDAEKKRKFIDLMNTVASTDVNNNEISTTA